MLPTRQESIRLAYTTPRQNDGELPGTHLNADAGHIGDAVADIDMSGLDGLTRDSFPVPSVNRCGWPRQTDASG